MDKSDALTIARRFAAIVKKNYAPKRIMLFGSYTRGNFHDESDFDIAVVLTEYDDSFDMRLDLMKLRRNIDSRIEPHPFREGDFTSANPIAFEILKYGEDIE